MHVNTDVLKDRIAKCNRTLDGVADFLGMNRSTLYRKIKNNGLSFSIGEMHGIVEYIPLTKEEAIAIFLSE